MTNPKSLTPEELDALAEAVGKMSPAPWGRDPNHAGGINCPECPVLFAVRIPPDAEEPGVFWTTADFDATIALRNSADRLIATARRAAADAARVGELEARALTAEAALAERDAEWQRGLADMHTGQSGDGCDSASPIEWTRAALRLHQMRIGDVVDARLEQLIGERDEARAERDAARASRDASDAERTAMLADIRTHIDRANAWYADLDSVAVSLGVETERARILQTIERVRGDIKRKDRAYAEVTADRDRLAGEVEAMRDVCDAAEDWLDEAHDPDATKQEEVNLRRAVDTWRRNTGEKKT